MTAGDLSIEPVARRLLGDPNRALSTKAELRYGQKGSLAVDLAKDTWFDHEAGEGGGAPSSWPSASIVPGSSASIFWPAAARVRAVGRPGRV